MIQNWLAIIKNWLIEMKMTVETKTMFLTVAAALVAVQAFLAAPSASAADEKEVLKLTLPAPTLKGTPEDLPKGDMIEPLSERELEVFKLLRSELSGPEIAQQLIISLHTLRTHTNNIYNKLGVNNRRAAVRRAEELDLL